MKNVQENYQINHLVFQSIPSEESFATFTRNRVEVITECAIATYTANLIRLSCWLFIFHCFLEQFLEWSTLYLTHHYCRLKLYFCKNWFMSALFLSHSSWNWWNKIQWFHRNFYKTSSIFLFNVPDSWDIEDLLKSFKWWAKWTAQLAFSYKQLTG